MQKVFVIAVVICSLIVVAVSQVKEQRLNAEIQTITAQKEAVQKEMLVFQGKMAENDKVFLSLQEEIDKSKAAHEEDKKRIKELVAENNLLKAGQASMNKLKEDLKKELEAEQLKVKELKEKLEAVKSEKVQSLMI